MLDLVIKADPQAVLELCRAFAASELAAMELRLAHGGSTVPADASGVASLTKYEAGVGL